MLVDDVDFQLGMTTDNIILNCQIKLIFQYKGVKECSFTVSIRPKAAESSHLKVDAAKSLQPNHLTVYNYIRPTRALNSSIRASISATWSNVPPQ